MPNPRRTLAILLPVAALFFGACTTANGPILVGAADGPSVIAVAPWRDWYDESLGARSQWYNRTLLTGYERAEIRSDFTGDRADFRARQLAAAIGLTAGQKRQVEALFARELEGPGMGPMDHRPSVSEVQARMAVVASTLDQISALLTPAQRAQFHRVPQFLGGGLTTRLPEARLQRLDGIVHLTNQQRVAVASILQRAFESTYGLSYVERTTPIGRVNVSVINRTARSAVVDLLTPAQKQALDAWQRHA